MYLVTYGADYPVKNFSWGLTPSTQEIKLFLQAIVAHNFFSKTKSSAIIQPDKTA